MSFSCISDRVIVEGVEHGDGVVAVVVTGEIDYRTSPQLREHLAEHITAGRRHLIVELSTVTFVDSTAIGVLVATAVKLEEAGGCLAVVCAEENERVLRIFEIAGVGSLIPPYSSREEAISAFSLPRTA